MRYLLLCACICLLAGCVSYPESPEALQQQMDADLVVGFQSWNSMAFIKPDVTGSAGAMVTRQKTFRRDGFLKLLNNLKIPRRYVVVVLDRRYDPDPRVAKGGVAEIEQFFSEIGFSRVAFQDVSR